MRQYVHIIKYTYVYLSQYVLHIYFINMQRYARIYIHVYILYDCIYRLLIAHNYAIDLNVWFLHQRTDLMSAQIYTTSTTYYI